MSRPTCHDRGEPRKFTCKAGFNLALSPGIKNAKAMNFQELMRAIADAGQNPIDYRVMHKAPVVTDGFLTLESEAKRK
jgi:hypothetical protein